MATIKAGCTKCGGAFGVLESQLGTEVQCPHCKARMKIPLLKRPSSASSSAPSTGAESALDDAAAQLGAAVSKPKPRGDGLDDLLAATQGQPAAGHERVESRSAHGHSAGHSHLDSSGDEFPARAPTGLMSNPGVVITLAGALVLIILVFAYFAITHHADVPDIVLHEQTQDDKPLTAAKSAVVAAVFKQGEDGRGPAPTIQSSEPLKLIEEKGTDGKNKPDEFFGRKNQLAHFAMFENKTSEVVERAAATISVWDDKKKLAEKTFPFRDVQPGQKVPAVVVYPYMDNDPKVRFTVKWQYGNRKSDKPVYKFSASVMGVRGYGDSGGTVTVEVTNDSEAAAPVVDVTVILLDVKTQHRTGYVSATVKNLKPHEVSKLDIPWDGFDSESINGGEAYAQLGGTE